MPRSTTGPYHQATNDTHLNKEWYLKRISAFRAWKLLGNQGSPQITYGTLDSNVILGNADFNSVVEPQVTDNFTIDSSGQARLSYAPDLVVGTYGMGLPTITVGGVARTLVDAAPGPGQVQVLRTDLYAPWGQSPGNNYYVDDVIGTATNVLQFNSADVGLTGQATYYDRRLLCTVYGDSGGFSYTNVLAHNTSRKDTLIGDLSLSYFPGLELHGTGVLGVAIAKGNDGLGTSGVAPGVRTVYSAAVSFAYDPRNAYDYAANALWLYSKGARVISLSSWWTNKYGANPDYNDPTMQAAGRVLEWLRQNGCLIFAATANDNKLLEPTVSGYAGSPTNYVLANLPGVVGVGAMDETDEQWYNSSTQASNYGAYVQFVTPGRNMLCPVYSQDSDGSITNDGTWYGGWFGHTSAAAPTAASCAALVWSANPALTNELVLSIMQTTGDRSFGTNFYTKFPNAVIPNAGKGVAKALSLANPGSIYVAPSFWARSGYTLPVELSLGANINSVFGTGPWSLVSVTGGVAKTTLTGPVAIDLAGYCTDAVTSVELWVGGVLKYSGPPAVVNGDATYDGSTNSPVKVVVRTAGDYAEETYTDVYVTTLSNVATNGPTAVSVAAGTIGITGYAPTLTAVSGPSTLRPPTATIQVAATAPTVYAYPSVLFPPTGLISMTAVAPSVSSSELGLRVWDGTQFVGVTIKYWNGTEFV